MARMKRVAPPPLVYKLYIQPFNPRKPHKFGMRIALPLLARDRKQARCRHTRSARAVGNTYITKHGQDEGSKVYTI